MREKGGNRLVPCPDYMVDALKLSNKAPKVSGESLQTSMAWRCPDGTKHLFCWPILAVSSQSLASNGPVVDSRYHDRFRTILSKWPISHPQSPFAQEMGRFHWPGFRRWKFDPSYFLVLFGVAPKHRASF
ncbi:hypothetical protein TNCV_563541 [Trichonephila clavipes]|nr:hypothetical protein TNCV_563541 [Trichonephila clavipes]